MLRVLVGLVLCLFGIWIRFALLIVFGGLGWLGCGCVTLVILFGFVLALYLFFVRSVLRVVAFAWFDL